MTYEKHIGFSGPQTQTRVVESDAQTTFVALASSDDAAYWVSFTIDAPIADTYILMPACAYNGNRFETVLRPYPPMFLEDELGVDVPLRMTRPPYLAAEGDSRMDVTSGDLTVPCVCVLNKATQEAFTVYFNQGDHGLNHGVTLEQTGDRLTITLRAPVKRRLIYRWLNGIPALYEIPGVDMPLGVQEGIETVIAHQVSTFPCADIPALFRAFFELRHAQTRAAAHASFPFSYFWKHAREQYDLDHYVEDEGYYALNSLSERDNHFSDWQIGWVGGCMSTLALLYDGTELSRERVIKTLEFAARYQSKAGWYYGIVGRGKVYSDCFRHYEDRYTFVLVRKQADAVYFLFKQIKAMEIMGIAVPETVRASAIAGADALVTLWKRYGQLGQFVDAESGDLIVGNSTSGAMAPGALAAAAEVTGNAEYAQVAREIGEYYYRTATTMGVTSGGPGEILQAPDSESAAALLESVVALYEYDGDEKWLNYALDAAHQAASWVVNYDYDFPPTSRFARMGIHAAGSVWANVQNKHSAPGLCTLSPSAFLKLYRFTGDERYLSLMQQIAHFMPQVASYPERPMERVQGGTLRPGEMCERVNMSDWEGTENIGDSIFGASAWPEVSMMLTWAEIPGVYVDAAQGIVSVSDHVEANLSDGKLCISNPTQFDATVKVMIDRETNKKLGLYWQEKLQKVEVCAGGCVSVELQ